MNNETYVILADEYRQFSTNKIIERQAAIGVFSGCEGDFRMLKKKSITNDPANNRLDSETDD
jgi:hypothetical protein